MRGWRRHLVGTFVALYVLWQLAVPTFGLYQAHDEGESQPFSWHMFSRIPAEPGDE